MEPYAYDSRDQVDELINAEASQLQIFWQASTPGSGLRPSACAGWDGGGDVVAHLTQGARTWSEAITRAFGPADFDPPPGQPATASG